MDPLSIEDFERQFLTGDNEDRVTPEVSQTRDALRSGPMSIEDFEKSFIEPDDDDQTNYGLEGSLKKSDLRKGRNARDIRAYMISRFGKRYRIGGKKDDNAVVEDFFDHMRAFNTNTVSTVTEARFMSKASDADKAAARRAYELYDATGNVFVNDGVWGAVDGVKDYFVNIATDPSNYIGALTGGVARASAFGVSQGAKATVRASIAKATNEALKKGATREAAKKAGKEAGEAVLDKAVKAGVQGPQARAFSKKVAQREYDLAMRSARLKARKGATDKIKKDAMRKSLYYTGFTDAGIAALQDAQIQGVYMDAEAQQEYSYLQTGLSSLLGGVGVGVQLLGMKNPVKSGLEDARIESEIMGLRERRAIKDPANFAKLLDKDGKKEITEDIIKNVKEWREKVDAGREQFGLAAATDLTVYKRIILGSTGKGDKDGLAYQLAKRGYKLSKGETISDALSSVTSLIPEKELNQINDMLKVTGMTLGEAAGAKESLGNLVAADANRGGTVLNVMSQASKIVNAGVVGGHDAINNATQEILKREADVADRSKIFSYGQNLWRRLLVSSPATTAINVAGFGQYYVGSTIADVITGTGYTVAGLAIGGDRGKQLRRVGAVYGDILGQKFSNLLDPYTTHDAYMAFLKENKKARDILFETVSGGIERTGERYGVDITKGPVKVAETVANAANMVAGVRVQDTFTKSQMFMSELDKYIRIKHGRSYMDIMRAGDTELIDDDVVGAAIDQTLRSVFSKDYTTDDQMLGTAAKLVEKFSSIPVVGTILPFGRFFNNVVATTYQWTAGGAVDLVSHMVRKDKSMKDITMHQAVARSTVGITALNLAANMDEERRQKNLGVYEVEIGQDIADLKNSYPFSAFLVGGRIWNLMRQGETIPQELYEELGTQIAVGQFAKDAQFGNDMMNILDYFLNESRDPQALGQVAGAFFSKAGGNYLSGYTRPLDALNKAVGYIADVDTAKDPRQARGLDQFAQYSTKYVDNIMEAFIGKIDSVTGEELAVGIREGDVYDMNPFARILGLTIKQDKTSAEELYSVAEMAPWKASERTEIPAYDKVFNKLLAPILEEEADIMLSSEKFQNANLNIKRKMVKNKLKEIRSKVKDLVESQGTEGEGMILAMRRKASVAGGRKEIKDEAKKWMKKNGWPTDFNEMNGYHLKMYLEYIEAIK